MKNKLMIYMIMSMLMLGIGYAFTVTIQSPAASSTVDYNTLPLINITFEKQNGTVACQAQITSPSTANSTGYNIFNKTNSSGETGQVNFTINFNTTIFEDSNDYTITANCQNDTQAVTGTDTNTGVIFDFTKPSTPNSTTTSGTKLKSGNVLTFNVNAERTTGCTIYFDSQTPITGTYGGNTCNYTFNLYTLPDKYYNYVYAKASDGTNTTNSIMYNYIIENHKNTNNPLAGVDTAVTTDIEAQQLGIGNGNNLLMYAFILTVVWFVFFYNKK